MTDPKAHIISSEATLLEALDRLNRLSGSSMTLFVTDPDGRMRGTVTDGDIRRALLAGHTPQSVVADAARSDFKALRPDDDADTVERLRDIRLRGIDMVPVLDSDGRISEVIDLRITPTRLPLRALLMAGGKGERLRPMTLTCPKPLLKIEGKAIIDYNIEALAACGVSDITVATGYLAEQIHAHFEAPVADVKVKCVREDRPMGTIGAATLLPHKDSGATLVMNSDLITTVSFEELYIRHRDSGADITVAVIPYQVAVPYAILTFEGDRVTGLEEKPSYSYYANAGIYIINNSVLDSLPQDTRTDATDLIEATIARGGLVVHYPVKGLWIDVGSPVDFRHAAELLQHHKTLSHGRF
ncbi:MAG: NTP transferase domain-containing protein [Muribaculaceae bacterium]|nr:NTP transferase domain-containing protein [Muribaculaceae bacterium]